MVASGGTGEVPSWAVALLLPTWWFGGWSLSWSRAELAIALLAFHLGRRLEYVVAGTLTEGNPGCLGCGDLPR